MIELELSIGFLLAIEQNNFGQLHNLLAEDMRFCGPVPRPLSKMEIISLLRAVRTGICNWQSHFKDVKCEGDFVSMTIEVTGAHLNTLPALLPGMPSYSPTGIYFHLPPERIEFYLRDNKIARIHIDPVPGGGIEGMLAQLGISVPAMN